MIDLTINSKTVEKNVEFCREKNIVLPTFDMMKNPEKIPGVIKDLLKRRSL